MQNDTRYSNIFFNDMTNRGEVHYTKNGKTEIHKWNDADEAASRSYIESSYGLYSKDKHMDALRILFEERRYNPIIDILEDVEWDGVERCAHFLHQWAKVEDSAYSREVSRLIFAGGIHRLYAPGTKFDDVPILIGTRQGEGKSSLIRFLAINDLYYGEINVVEGQQAIEQLQGKWICEIGELIALTKNKEQEAVKAYITRAVDNYRRPYDRHPTDLPRRCVFIGSTNDSAPLIDKTGNRRYYPVEVHSDGYEVFDQEEEIREYVLQCWAEAKVLYDRGEMPNYADRKLVKEYREAQQNAMQDDWRQGAIGMFLDKKKVGELTCIREIAHEALSPNPDIPKDPSLAEAKDIGRIMDRYPGWRRCTSPRKVGRFGVQRCWEKVKEEEKTEDDVEECDIP